MRRVGTPAAAAAAVGALLIALAVPTAHAQALAAAGNGLAAAGFPFNFPFLFNPTPLCNFGFTINPWVPPATIQNAPGGLITILNGKPKFADVTICCGTPLNFVWTGTHSVWQLLNPTCPATFVNNATAGQRQLVAPSANGNATLTMNTPGTYYFTSAQGTDCTDGMLLKVVVPFGNCAGGTSAFAGGPGSEQQTTVGQGSQASALGPPNGTSTSANNGNAAAASGPPGTSHTATGPGFSYSASGGRRLRAPLTHPFAAA